MEWLSACPMSLGALCGICGWDWEQGVRLKRPTRFRRHGFTTNAFLVVLPSFFDVF